jgi:hypothetical protein
MKVWRDGAIQTISIEEYKETTSRDLRHGMRGSSIKNARAALRLAKQVTLIDRDGEWQVVVSFKNADNAEQAFEAIEIERGAA